MGFRAIDGQPAGLRAVVLPASEIDALLGAWFEELGPNVVH